MTSAIYQRGKLYNSVSRCSLQAERKRIRGTAVTQESFNAWRLKFNKERQARKKIQDEERMREMSNKEKEEYKKYASRLTGE